MDNFVHLHCHSNFSLLDGLIKIPELFKKIKQLEQPAIAITDHGNMASIFDAQAEAKKNNIKYIPGFEAYVVPDAKVKSKEERSSETDIARKHLILLAKNNEGLKRLIKICSWGHTEGFYFRPRIDDFVLEKYGTEGLIASSACIAGSISQYILRGQYDKAKKKALYYQQLFNGNFYLELMCHNKLQIEVNKGLIQLSKDTGIKLILSSDAHYLNKEDKEAHEVLLAVQTRTTMDDPKRWKFEPGYYYIMDSKELIRIMHEHHSYIPDDILQEAMNNTVRIAEQCNVEFNFGKHYLPKIDPYKELQSDPQLLKEFNTFETRRLLEVAKRNNISLDDAKARLDASNEMVRFLCIHGYNGLYKQHFIDAKHLSLFLYELDTIISLGFASYFLILYEIQFWATKNNILVGF